MATAEQAQVTEKAAEDEVVNTIVDAEATVAPRRFFTIPGRDPFDEIEWELRHAHIPGKDGPAFEQKDVEFPKFWSQTATNIVSQKYFRGRMASPERERSVKQMIGRVVDTIGGWGREGGYFANDEEAETFEAELKAILVKQYASFNSPVWFNVGFEAKPQCSRVPAVARARLDARRDGPDRRARRGGADRPRGLRRGGRHAHRRRQGERTQGGLPGHAPQRQLRRGDWRPRRQGRSRAAHHSRRGCGSTSCSPGMRMHLHPHRAKVADRAARSCRGRVRHCVDDVPISRPTPVAVAEAALAGWLQADGFVGQYEEGTNRSLTIEFQVANDDEYDVGHRRTSTSSSPTCTGTCASADAGHRRCAAAESVSTARTSASSSSVGSSCSAAPRSGCPSSCGRLHAKRSAHTSAASSRQTATSRVRRDNGNENGRVAFAVIGERWAEDIQLLLNVLGIYSRRQRKDGEADNRHDLHEVSISIGSERARFAELVGFVGADKQRKLLESLGLRGLKNCPDLREEEIVSIESIGVRDVYDIQTESGEYLTNNVAVHNCFILSIEDSMESILDWIRREGVIFRGGSGSGVNLSRLRSSKEQLSKGGYASGPVSFMRGADASAGTIKSGGKTRRAAKMVVLDVDHPDIDEFIWCKAKEERKARVLEQAGYDMSLDSPDWASIQYQNANNSVRVTDAFMEAVIEGKEWNLTARTDGSVVETTDARDLIRQMAEAAWECADPGVQYDTTINSWHTLPNTSRINASNPCSRVHVHRRQRVQPRLAEPHEVPPRGRRVRHRSLRARSRRRVPRAGDRRRLLVLSRRPRSTGTRRRTASSGSATRTSARS